NLGCPRQNLGSAPDDTGVSFFIDPETYSWNVEALRHHHQKIFYGGIIRILIISR
ncbi:unnamed protein product, partial [Ilex paraguariensis]